MSEREVAPRWGEDYSRLVDGALEVARRAEEDERSPIRRWD